MPGGRPKLDLRGQRFGKLTCVEMLSPSYGHSRARAICDCGGQTICKASVLKSGQIRSWGCLVRERMIALNKGRTVEPGNELRGIYCGYQRGAAVRGLVFELTYPIFRDLCLGKCHYCGGDPSNKTKHTAKCGITLYNGIDRKDNTKGYELNNVLTCCKPCNKAKEDISYEDFISYLDRLVKFRTEVKCR